jgi:hypothetical protein
MADPKLTHSLDQFSAYWGSLGSGFAAFVREAEASGCTHEEALRAGHRALVAWIRRPIDPPSP